MDIYDADGLLDWAKVLGQLDEILSMPRGQDGKVMRDRLVNLLDECTHGSALDPGKLKAVFTAWECVCDETPEQHYHGQGCSKPGCGCEAGWQIVKAGRP